MPMHVSNRLIWSTGKGSDQQFAAAQPHQQEAIRRLPGCPSSLVRPFLYGYCMKGLLPAIGIL
eukprot:5220922-Amphidinium_carterae.1